MAATHSKPFVVSDIGPRWGKVKEKVADKQRAHCPLQPPGYEALAWSQGSQFERE